MKKPFFKRTPVKIALLTLSFPVTMGLGYILVYIAQNMYQAMYIRVIIGAAGVLWGVITVVWIWLASDYTKLWKSWLNELKGSRMQRARKRYPEYMALREKYPLAIARHERHCMHHKPPMSYKEMIEEAISVDEKEWAEREAFRRANREERKQYKVKRPPTLREEATHQGEKL